MMTLKALDPPRQRQHRHLCVPVSFTSTMLSLFTFLVFVTFSVAQRDPLKEFCRIHSHQTTVVDRKLYIDGGLVNWSPLTAESINYTSIRPTNTSVLSMCTLIFCSRYMVEIRRP
jgi:hypothetical protein